MITHRRGALALCLACLTPATLAAPIWVGRFPAGGGVLPAPWDIRQLDDRVAPTRYALRTWDGVAAVEATAERSMTLLGRPLDIDLAATPHLCWLWRIDAPLVSADMTRKSGDDYAARVYLTFQVAPEALEIGTRAKLALARTLYGDRVPDAALNYVWDNRQPVGTLRDNAYTDRARMIVLRSGAGDTGRWLLERRDVAADFRRAFGDLPARLTGLAVASDTDNTGERAHAGFAEFRFVAADDACAMPAGVKDHG